MSNQVPSERSRLEENLPPQARSSLNTTPHLHLKQQLHAVQEELRSVQQELQAARIELQGSQLEVQSAQLQLKAAQQELEVARRQLGDLEDVVQDLPQIFERKFQQRLQPLLDQQRLLAQDNHSLREQARRALPPAPSEPVEPSGRFQSLGGLEPLRALRRRLRRAGSRGAEPNTDPGGTELSERG